MKSFKLYKPEYPNLERMYRRLKLISPDKQVDVSNLYVSPWTYSEMKRLMLWESKRNNRHYTPQQHIAAVEMHLLNLGPNVLEGVKDKYIIVNTKQWTDGEGSDTLDEWETD